MYQLLSLTIKEDIGQLDIAKTNSYSFPQKSPLHLHLCQKIHNSIVQHPHMMKGFIHFIFFTFLLVLQLPIISQAVFPPVAHQIALAKFPSTISFPFEVLFE